MSNTELIRELRALTQAGMKDCKEALEEANWDIQKAVDLVKVKGLAIADGRTGLVTSEGKIGMLISDENDCGCMIEINCQTDFVANSDIFRSFAANSLMKLAETISNVPPFESTDVESERKEVVVKTKENVVIRRWCVEETQLPTEKVFGYQHSNHKIGVLVTMRGTHNCPCMATPCPHQSLIVASPEFRALGEDLAMQICAMRPLAVSPDLLSSDEICRQKAIFETQLKEEKKPEKMWEKILEGKFNKWYKEICLLEQESVVVPKTTVKQVVKNVGTKIGGEITVINFIRYEVSQ